MKDRANLIIDYFYLLFFSIDTLFDKAIVTMNILLKVKPFTHHFTPRVCCRFFSKDKTYFAPQNFTDYENIKQIYKPEVPEFFNFASDVLDKWTAAEKVICSLSIIFTFFISLSDTFSKCYHYSFPRMALRSPTLLCGG